MVGATLKVFVLSVQKDQNVVVCLSGRGDKDMERVSANVGFSLEE
jgi:tryptophan synthase beta subunit